MWYIYTMGYYTAEKKTEKEILPFAKTWLGSEGTRLSKISPTKTHIAWDY